MKVSISLKNSELKLPNINSLKKLLSKYFIFFLLIFSFSIPAQKSNDLKTPPKNKDAKEAEKSKREIRKEERKEWKERRKLEKEEQKMIKAYHKRIQTKTVLKRMKKSKQKAQMNNENKREFFLKRWFSKKKR